MSDDIVARLRKWSAGGSVYYESVNDMREAADEIERLRSIVEEQRSAWRRALVSLYAFPGITDWRTYPNPQRSDGLFVAQEGRLEYGEQAVPYGVRSICSQLPHEDAKWVAEQLNVCGKQLAEDDRVWDEWHPVGRLYRETERLRTRVAELEEVVAGRRPVL